jgi:glycine/D-amino acid oxidase-like deaminating enzyme
MTRVAVIGAGVLGATIAWRLSGDGHAVTLIDQRPGGIASRGSFGWLNAASAEDDRYCAVRQRSLALWHRLARERPDCPAAFPGFLLWEVPPGELEAMARRLSALGHPAELVDRPAMARLEPGLIAPPATALWLPTEGRADPRAIAEWFARAAVDAGAALCPETVTGIERDAGGWQLRLGLERIGADELVIAAGAATPELLAPLGYPIALRIEPGLLVRTRPAPASLGAMLGSPEVHLWQAADGTVLAGSDYGGTQRFDDAQAEAQVILSRAESLAAGLGRLEPDAVSVTNRPMLADGRPAAGRLAEGLLVAVTHSGMTLAPLIAESVAAEIAGRPPDSGLAAYRPDRPEVVGAPAPA